MAEMKLTRWKCDRCERVSDERFPHPGTRWEVRVSVDYQTAGGNMIAWSDMCVSCHSAVGQDIDAMVNRAKATRKNIPGGSTA